ncbi:MAG: hypothetical protein KKC03_14035 [Bacteroidetes bacterium]|nr:hypothetical protein [Bacteroidota bacterium]
MRRNEMPHFDVIVYACTGLLAILGSVKIVTGAIMKKESAEIKKPCGEKFIDHIDKIRIVKQEMQESKDRIFELEINYGHILEKITKIEIIVDRNAEQTAQIYNWMAERKSGGKWKK